MIKQPPRSNYSFVAAMFAASMLTPPSAIANGNPRDKVFVPPVQGKNITPEILDALFDLTVAAVSRADIVDIVTIADVQDQLAQEKRKDSLGCSNVSCASEIAGALGVRYLLAVRAKKLGGNLMITTSFIDTTEQKSKIGQGECPNREEEYRKAVESAVVEALGLAKRSLPLNYGQVSNAEGQSMARPSVGSSTGNPTSPKDPVIVFNTTAGTFTVELFADEAPIGTDNMMDYVSSGFYSGVIFHRVIPGFVVQGGGFDKGFHQKAARAPIKNEAHNGLKNLRGTLSWARTNDPNSATSQFFINLVDNAMLDPHAGSDGYAVFGKVLSGMDVVEKIRDGVIACPSQKGTQCNAPVPPGMLDVPAEPVVIERASVRPGAEPTSAPLQTASNVAPGGEAANAILQKSSDTYERELQRNPGDPQIHFRFGMMLEEKGMFDRALTEYDTAVRLEPGLLLAYYRSARVSDRLLRPQETTRMCQQVVALMSDAKYENQHQWCVTRLKELRAQK